MRMRAHYLTRIRRARAHHLCAPALELCACKPRHLRVQQAVAADLELHGEAVRAIGARLEDEQVGTAGPAAAGLVSALHEGGAAGRAVHEDICCVAPCDALDLQARLGVVVRLARVRPLLPLLVDASTTIAITSA